MQIEENLTEDQATQIVNAMQSSLFPTVIRALSDHLTSYFGRMPHVVHLEEQWVMAFQITLMPVMLQFEHIAEMVLYKAKIALPTRHLLSPAMATTGIDESMKSVYINKYCSLKGSDQVMALEVISSSIDTFLSNTFGAMQYSVDAFSAEDVHAQREFFNELAMKMERIVEHFIESSKEISMNTDDFAKFSENAEKWSRSVDKIVSEGLPINHLSR
ncbi:MAG: hypothetical protein HOL70_03740 [Candidatus Marinimicrobia bacterium]|jgi:hypothetical protein|nr:hypothetical protein [Candidatus Neomarinimicrobiota bacterium]